VRTMSVREIARRLFAVLCIGWLLWLAIWWFCRPVVLLHYAEDAREPVVYFFNDNHLITKQEIKPGRVERFYTDLFPGADSFINVSLPFASRDGVEFKPPFSRVDIYINSATRIERVEKKYGFFDRFQ